MLMHLNSDGQKLTYDLYKQCFGYRYDDFMHTAGINDVDIQQRIRKIKGEVYPFYFDYLQPNKPLIILFVHFIGMGGTPQ